MQKLLICRDSIGWSFFEQEPKKDYSNDQCRPSKTISLMVGLYYLKNVFNENDASIINKLIENPSRQYFQ
ncbi:hypothetical protein J7K93_00355 [bacterium]|nr:hypothetical protein [bacterium]